MELQERLNRIFREVFDDASITITREMTSNDIDGWDSLSHVNLIVAVESQFGIRFTTKEATSMKNVGELIDLVGKKTGGGN